jgi:hypothetical protein
VSDRLEVPMTLRKLAGIHRFARGQDKELVKQCDDVTPRLMDCEDNSPIVVTSKGYKTIDHIVCVEGIQTFANASARHIRDARVTHRSLARPGIEWMDL